MADQESISHLRSGPVAWNRWRATWKTLRGPDLRGLDLRRAYLRGANLSGADLRRANLREATLEGADLRQSRLDGACLRSANIRSANLQNATLREAELVWANLTGTNLASSDLQAADLSGANLRSADLTRTLVDYARFEGAIFGDTRLIRVDLSLATGLDDAHHAAPSSIGVDTLYASNGSIGRRFLQGCGVPSVMIEYIPSLTVVSAIEFYSAFLSYSAADSDFADRLGELLRQHGISVWRDVHGLVPGDDVDLQIDRAIKDADRVLLLCSSTSLTSWWVDRELSKAFEKERRLWNTGRLPKGLRIVVPIDVDGYLFGDDSDHHAIAELRRTHAARFGSSLDDASFARAADGVLRALRPVDDRVRLLSRGKLSIPET